MVVGKYFPICAVIAAHLRRRGIAVCCQTAQAPGQTTCRGRPLGAAQSPVRRWPLLLRLPSRALAHRCAVTECRARPCPEGWRGGSVGMEVGDVRCSRMRSMPRCGCVRPAEWRCRLTEEPCYFCCVWFLVRVSSVQREGLKWMLGQQHRHTV